MDWLGDHEAVRQGIAAGIAAIAFAFALAYRSYGLLRGVLPSWITSILIVRSRSRQTYDWRSAWIADANKPLSKTDGR